MESLSSAVVGSRASSFYDCSQIAVANLDVMKVPAALVVGASSQACNVTTLQFTTPSSGHVALQTYSYCGGNLNITSYIHNDDYNKVVTVYYTDAAGDSTPLTSLQLNYQESVGNTGWEIWSAVTPAYYDGVDELLNITYQATDIGQTYHEILNADVTASGAPAPTIPGPPPPYASPLGFSDDISEYLEIASGSQPENVLSRMFLNINPSVSGIASGVVVAGQSGPSYPSNDPDYEYTWVRDSSLTMSVVQKLYHAATNSSAKSQFEGVLFQYAGARANEQIDPNLQTGLGEPKFNLDNSVFTGPWGRPQNDGPATSAITLMQFAHSYLAAGGDLQTVNQKIYNSSAYPSTAPVQKDLLFVARNWSSPTFDLWEEVEDPTQFYDRIVQRRALKMGVKFANLMNDSSTAATLNEALNAITLSFDLFWNPGRQILLYEYGPVLRGKSSFLDNAVVLGLIHGYAHDGFYAYTNDQVQSTIVRLATSFIDVFPLFNSTQHDAEGRPLGIPQGRYPEDTYTGTGSVANGGNPWYLCTAALAQYFFTAASEYNAAGKFQVTNTSKDFFDYFAPAADVTVGKTYSRNSAQFNAVVAAFKGWGDSFFRTVKFFTPSTGRLAEEYNRNNGTAQGCPDLTWSYAAFLTAAFKRASLNGQTDYVETLANLGFAPN